MIKGGGGSFFQTVNSFALYVTSLHKAKKNERENERPLCGIAWKGISLLPRLSWGGFDRLPNRKTKFFDQKSH